MADEMLSPSDPLPPACRYFREIFADPSLTDHDMDALANHMATCAACASAIGKAINERSTKIS